MRSSASPSRVGAPAADHGRLERSAAHRAPTTPPDDQSPTARFTKRRSAIAAGLIAAVGLLAVSAAPVDAVVYRSSGLGWTPGQDVTAAFSSLLKSGTFTTGDELLLDATYRVSGTHQLPDNFTLAAVKDAGFEVTDANSSKEFLRLGDATTLRNLTINYLNTPPLGPGATNPVRGVDFFSKPGITASGKSDIRIENCRMVGSIAHHLRLSSCDRPQITGSHFLGGFWTIYLNGTTTDPVFRNSVFEQIQGDGIKTVGGGTVLTEGAIVDSCVFQDCGRDGIDTTGGFKDSVVRNSIFRRLFIGMDIKSGYHDPSDLATGISSNTGIDIEDSIFTDTGGVVLSTIDRGFYERGKHLLDTANCHDFAPHDIDIVDSVFETTQPKNGRMLHLKGGHTVRYSDVSFLSVPGHTISIANYTNVYDTFGPNTLSEEVSRALNYGVTGSGITYGHAGPPGDTFVPFVYGPIPEPGTLALLTLAGLPLARRHRGCH